MRYVGPVHFRYAPGSTVSSDLEGLARTFLGQLQGVYPRSPTKGMFRAGPGWAMKVMFVNGRPVVDIRTTEETPVVEDVTTVPLGLAFVFTPYKNSGVFVHDDPWHEYIMSFNPTTGARKIQDYSVYAGVYWFGNERPVCYNVTWDNGVDTCSWTGARYSASFFMPYSLRTGKFSVNGVIVSHSVPSPQVILGAGILHANIDETSDTPAGKFTCRLATAKFIPSPSTGVVNFAVGINIYDIYVSIANGVATEYRSPTLIYTYEYPNNTIDNGLSKLRGWAFDRTATRCVSIVESGVGLFQHEIDLSGDDIAVNTISYGAVGTISSMSMSASTFDGVRIKNDGGALVPDSSGSSEASGSVAAENSPLAGWLPIAADYDGRTNELVIAYVQVGSFDSVSWTVTGESLNGGGFTENNAVTRLRIGSAEIVFGGYTAGEVINAFTDFDAFTGHTYYRSNGNGVICDLDVRYGAALLFGGNTSVVRDFDYVRNVPITHSFTSTQLCTRVLSDGAESTHLGGVPTTFTSTFTADDSQYAALYDHIPDELQNGTTFVPVSSGAAAIDTMYPNAHDSSRGVLVSYYYIDGVNYAYGLASYLDTKSDMIHTLACTYVSFTTPVSSVDGETITELLAPSPSNPMFPLGVV